MIKVDGTSVVPPGSRRWRRSGACMSSQGDAQRRHARPTRRIPGRMSTEENRGACLSGANREET
jgi:hypothetical protein